MSRVKTVADEEEISVNEAESSSASEIETQQAEESSAADGTEKSDGTEDSASKAEAENVSSDVNENIAAEKKYGIVRYFQMNPLENKTLERTLKKMYGRESHSLSGWKSVIEKFLNQKV